MPHSCLVCLNKSVSHVCLPCGHAVLCKTCAPLYGRNRRFKQCGVCRRALSGTQELFFATPLLPEENAESGASAEAGDSQPDSDTDYQQAAADGAFFDARWAAGHGDRAQTWVRNHHGEHDLRFYAVWSLGGEVNQSGVHGSVGPDLHDHLLGIYGWSQIRWRRTQSLQDALDTYMAEAVRKRATVPPRFFGR